MVKKSSKVFYEYNGKMMSVCDIYKSKPKCRGRSKYILSADITVEKNDTRIPAKLVFVRNRSNRSDYLCLISTDVSLSEEEIIRIHKYI